MGRRKDRSPFEIEERLGRLAIERGFISPEQFQLAFDVRDRDGITLAESLLKLQLLTSAQLHRLQIDSEGPPDFPPLGRFSIARELGRGSSAVVFEALDTADGTRVALKIFHPGPIADLDRFLREGVVASKIPPHPGIVGVREAGEIDGRRFISMDLVPGVHMDEWVRRGSVAFPSYIQVLRDAALAVDHAHRHGVIHRDLKPENILVELPGGRARVGDFGLAKTVTTPEGMSITAAGIAVGTPAYMSPEQILGRPDVDRRSDVWALGVMLYEGLTGERPFGGSTAFEAMRKAVSEPPPRPSKASRLQMNPLLFGTVERIALKALSKNPRDRYSSARAFADDLTRWLAGETFDVFVAPPPAPPKPPRIRKLLPFAAAVLLGAGAAAAFFLGRDGEPARPALRTPELAGARGAVLEYFGGIQFNSLGKREIDARARFDAPGDPVWPDGPEFYVSRRWSGRLEAPKTGPYVFSIRANEGARLVVARSEVVSNFVPGMATERSGRVVLERGLHEFQVEAFHQGEPGEIEIFWGREGSPAVPLGPGDLSHDPDGFRAVAPPSDNGPIEIPGAQEGEALEIVEASGRPTAVQPFGAFRRFWRGRWSGKAHLWWGTGTRKGDVLTLRFRSAEAGPRTLVLGLTRAMDHGIFELAVNGRPTGRTLDLYGADLATEEVELPGLDLVAGPNALSFRVVGSNPAAREWGPGGGLHKLGLDYVLVRP